MSDIRMIGRNTWFSTKGNAMSRIDRVMLSPQW